MHYAWNILDTWRYASDSHMSVGMEWYGEANRIARELDPKNPARAAGIIAALSPMVDWDRNVEMARFVYANGHAQGLGLARNCAKAERILNGEAPLDVLGGNKVRAFFQTIVNPLSEELVVIDRHAFDIALGKIHTDSDRKINNRVYAELSNAYFQAATIANVLPNQMQAVTWVAHREWKVNN